MEEKHTHNFTKEIHTVNISNQVSKQVINQVAKRVETTKLHQKNNFLDLRTRWVVK